MYRTRRLGRRNADPDLLLRRPGLLVLPMRLGGHPFAISPRGSLRGLLLRPLHLRVPHRTDLCSLPCELMGFGSLRPPFIWSCNGARGRKLVRRREAVPALE